jgi:hypothetical protein
VNDVEMGMGIVIPLSFMNRGERGIAIFVGDRNNTDLLRNRIEVVQKDNLLQENGKIRVRLNGKTIEVTRDDAASILVLIPVTEALNALRNE